MHTIKFLVGSFLFLSASASTLMASVLADDAAGFGGNINLSSGVPANDKLGVNYKI